MAFSLFFSFFNWFQGQFHKKKLLSGTLSLAKNPWLQSCKPERCDNTITLLNGHNIKPALDKHICTHILVQHSGLMRQLLCAVDELFHNSQHTERICGVFMHAWVPRVQEQQEQWVGKGCKKQRFSRTVLNSVSKQGRADTLENSQLLWLPCKTCIIIKASQHSSIEGRGVHQLPPLTKLIITADGFWEDCQFYLRVGQQCSTGRPHTNLHMSSRN